jgi:hypothetical protein
LSEPTAQADGAATGACRPQIKARISACLSNMSCQPIPFAGSGLSRRCVSAPSWDELHAALQTFPGFAPKPLFYRENRYNTVVGVLFSLGALLGIWPSNVWLPTIQAQMLARIGVTAAAAAPFIGHGLNAGWHDTGRPNFRKGFTVTGNVRFLPRVMAGRASTRASAGSVTPPSLAVVGVAKSGSPSPSSVRSFPPRGLILADALYR